MIQYDGQNLGNEPECNQMDVYEWPDEDYRGNNNFELKLKYGTPCRREKGPRGILRS